MAWTRARRRDGEGRAVHGPKEEFRRVDRKATKVGNASGLRLPLIEWSGGSWWQEEEDGRGEEEAQWGSLLHSRPWREVAGGAFE